MPIGTEIFSNCPMDKAALDQLWGKTARLSGISTSGLVLMKCIVGCAIGSVSIKSDAIHSLTDLVAALIAFFSVGKSAEPPDAHHEFGHGKFENISGLIEALIIFITVFLIIWEVLKKIARRIIRVLKTGTAHRWYRCYGFLCAGHPGIIPGAGNTALSNSIGAV